MDANRSYERIARELLDEVDETDRREDEMYGQARGDELPEQLCMAEGRRVALREAKRELGAAGEEEGGVGDEGDADGEQQRLVAFDLDRERILNSEQGRRGWMREGRRQLDELRRQQARPIAASRADRLRESKRRLEEEHRVELEANAAYEAYKARGDERRPSVRQATKAVRAAGGTDRDDQHDRSRLPDRAHPGPAGPSGLQRPSRGQRAADHRRCGGHERLA